MPPLVPMRRQSLRPRQIDIHARMRTICSPHDLIQDEEMAPTLSASYEELIATNTEENLPISLKAKRKKNIPTPVVLSVKTYEEEVKDDFFIPTSYIRVQNLPHFCEDSRVEFDLEKEDMLWLRNHSKYGASGDPRFQLTYNRLCQMLDALEKASAIINPNVITLAEAEEVFAKQLGIIRSPVHKVGVDVYNYWIQKRQKLKRPCLRKYWPQTPLNDTNPHQVFRPREKERYKLRKHRKNDMDGYKKLLQLRSDFCRARRLLELVRRREKCIRLTVDFLAEIRQQYLHELTRKDARKPNIPIGKDQEKHRRRRRKRRKTRKDGSEEASDDDDDSVDFNDPFLSDGAFENGKDSDSYDPYTKNADKENTSSRIPSFLEYDTSKNFTLRRDANPELLIPYTTSYPLPTSYLLATMLDRPTNYHCRGRIARGGRIVIDRIPPKAEKMRNPIELIASSSIVASEFLKRPRIDGQDPKTMVDSVINSTPAPFKIHSTSLQAMQDTVHPIHDTINEPDHIKKSFSDLKSRLNDIYDMSDSEDEIIESYFGTKPCRPGRKVASDQTTKFEFYL